MSITNIDSVCRKYGLNAFFIEPASRDLFTAMLARMLGGRQADYDIVHVLIEKPEAKVKISYADFKKELKTESDEDIRITLLGFEWNEICNV
mgnify:CR=1 FL=1